MIIYKITTGFVIQTFDTDKSAYIEQVFVAGNPVDYEDVEGNHLSDDLMREKGFGPHTEEPYLPFEMVQPGKKTAYLQVVEEAVDNAKEHAEGGMGSIDDALRAFLEGIESDIRDELL